MGRFPIEIAALGKDVEILCRRSVSGEPALGEGYFTLLRGTGLEFKDFREYGPGEDSRHIDWKASLRSDKLLIRNYLQEKGADIIFVYDVSENMLFGSQRKIKAHYGAELILTLAATALELGYNIGLVCFSDKLKNVLSPATSESQFALFYKILGDYSTYGGGFDIAKVLDFVQEGYQQDSVVFFISDFLDFDSPSKSIEMKFKKLALKYDLISIILRDPRDEALPSENIEVLIASPYDNRETVISTKKIKKGYEEYNKFQKGKVRKFLKDVNSDCIEVYTDKPFITSLVTFFKRRDALLK